MVRPRRFLMIAVAAPLLLAQQDEARDRLKSGADHLQRSELESAIRELKRAVAIQPKSAAAHQLLGQAYLAQGKLEMMAEAKAELQQALDLDPTLTWARFYLAKLYLDLGRLDRAKQELERGLQRRPNIAHLLALLGEVERRIGNPGVCLDLNRKALEIDPEMNAAHYYLALAHLDLKSDEDAIRELETALRSKYVIPEMYVTLGSIYTGQRKLQSAAELFRKAIALDPSRPEGHLRLAEVFRMQGSPDRALDELKLAAPPDRQFLHTAYYQQIQSDIYFEMGRAYEAQGRTREAVAAYAHAVEINPEHAKAQDQLAIARSKLR